MIPVTFFVNFPLRQLIVFRFEITFFATAFVAEGVGEGVAKTVLGVALARGVGEIVALGTGVTSTVGVAVEDGVADGTGKGDSDEEEVVVGADPPEGAGDVGAAAADPIKKVKPVEICDVEFPALSSKGFINNSQVPLAKVLGIDTRQRYEP